MIKRNTKNRIHFSCPSHESAPIPQRLLTYGLLGVLGLALVLRIWGIGFGLPYDFTPDEVHEIIRALKLGAGEYSWTPGKGGLYLILFIEYGALFGFWWLTGQIDTPTDFALMYLQDPTAFYLSGRITVAIMGAFTCLVVYWIGNRLYGWKVGFAAAAIGAMAHYHAVWSHYINVDIGMTLAIWLSILAYLKYEETTNVRWLLATGAFAGVAFAFKFPGIVVVVPLLLAVASKARGESARRHPIRDFGLIVLATLITATVVVPENVLQVGAVTRQFSNLISSNDADQKPQTESREADDEFDAAVFDVTIMHNDDYVSLLLKKTYIVLTISVLVGAAFGIWRRNRWDTIWIIFIIVFLGVMSLADRPALQRYMLPVIPAMWLLGARGAAAVAQFLCLLLFATITCLHDRTHA
jgi:4-amino-4-deoxy-L-arabinose transferase-like glycosyltransferase